MRTGLMGSSLLALVALAACDVRTTTAPQAAKEEGPVDPKQAIWTGATVGQLRKAIDARAAHGLDHQPFAVAGEPGSPDGQAALTRAALTYAGALAGGATDPTKLYDIYTVPRPKADLRAGLASALQAGKVNAWLDGLAPADANYRKLSQAYLALRKPDAANSAAIPDIGKAINPGGVDPRLPAIVQQLVIYDYLDRAAAATPGNRYMPAVVAAVKAMQADYGIKPDGVIGSDALAILNLSDADRARAIAVNMERLRWLERTPPATRIDVNVAAARLAYWRDGKLVDSRKVVVGEPDKETPQLGSPIFRLVANPTWTVPRSVQEKELAGKGAGYLKANNMAWEDGWIVQQSGPKNSLGLVKFDMTNEHAIYLHDTPAKQLFGQALRQRSHGCVRVEDALGFAEILARDEGVTDAWHQARATGKQTFVSLPRQIPVRMLYQTVLFDEDGTPIVRADPYGWNDRIASALGFPAGKSWRFKTHDADVGP